MTFAPATLVELGAFWTAHDGVMLGIVGDTDHASKGVSYHLGSDQLAPGAYSATTARDRAGLSNAASAIDLGRLDGSLERLRDFSRWLVAQGRENAPGTRDIREIIYSPDGRVVLRWDRERGYQSIPRAGEADDSHLLHTHVSYYRDAESRDKVGLFATYGEFMSDTINTGGSVTSKRNATVKPASRWYHDGELTLKGGTFGATAAVVPYIGAAKGGGRAVIVNTGIPYDDHVTRPTIVYLRSDDVTITDAPTPPAPDCSTEIAAAIAADRGKAHIVYE